MSIILLIAIALFGVQNMSATSEQKAAAKEIEALGGLVVLNEEIGFKGAKFGDAHLRLLRPFRSVPDLLIWFSGANISDEGVRQLATFDELGGLSFSDVELSDQGILAIQISQKKRLTVFGVSGTRPIQISDAIMPQVAGLIKLQQVHLGNTCVTSRGLEHLAQLTNLEMLDLSGTSIDDDGLIHLSKLTKLWWLALGANDITDNGVQHLRPLVNLNTLLLDDTQVTDAGLVQLTPMKKLRALRLDGTKITGKNLGVLMDCPALAQLDVERTPVSLPELRALQHHPSLDCVDLFRSEEAKTNPEWEEFWLNLPFVKARAAKLEANRKRAEEGRKKRGGLPGATGAQIILVGDDGQETVLYSTDDESEDTQ